MPFATSRDADVRLVTDNSRLTPQEVRDLMPWMRQISEAGMRHMNAELALQNLEAIQKFERSSSKLTGWLIGLTVVLVLLTGVLVEYAILLERVTRK